MKLVHMGSDLRVGVTWLPEHQVRLIQGWVLGSGQVRLTGECNPVTKMGSGFLAEEGHHVQKWRSRSELVREGDLSIYNP